MSPRGTLGKKARATKRESRHSELSSVALDLFAERGFSGTSIKDIAAKARINPALIYYYYKDKADLFRAAIAQAVSLAHKHYLQLRLRSDDPMGRIHAWLESNVVLAQRIRSMVKIMLDYASTGMRNRGIDTTIREFYELERMILVESIRRGVSEGVFAPTNADRLAAMISVHLDGVMVASSIRVDFDMEEAIDDIKGLLVRYLQPATGATVRTKSSAGAARRAPGSIEAKNLKRRAS